jgi:hypothetical protein
MAATRVRVESVLEWALAAAFVFVALAVGSLVVREFRTVSAVTTGVVTNGVTSVIARETPAPAPAVPAAVPPRAVSVPVLLLPDGNSVRVGETLSAVAARLGRQAEAGAQAVERAPNGERLTRFYEHAGSRFVLVFEPFERDAEPKVAAIYLQ